MDGSQKLPQRWLDTLVANTAKGRQCPAILRGISAWIHHLRGANGPVDDPPAVELATAAAAPVPLQALFGPEGLMGAIWNRPQGKPQQSSHRYSEALSSPWSLPCR